MAYRYKNHLQLAAETRRIVEDQIDKAVEEIDDEDLDPGDTIHQVRKRCKKIRAVLRLARGALSEADIYQAENRYFRDIARELSMLRDSQVLIQTHDDLARGIGNPDLRIACAAVRGRLVARQYALREQQDGNHLAEVLYATRDKLLTGRERVPGWTRQLRRFRDLEPGLVNSYRRGRRAMRWAKQTGKAEAFHEWRKHAKYHWHACSLLREIWPTAMEARRRESSRLSELLGDEHDLSVYRGTLEANPGWFGDGDSARQLLVVVDQSRDTLRRAAFPCGARLYAEKPKALGKRFGKYWQAWRETAA